jgi:phosphate transport system permease protein
MIKGLDQQYITRLKKRKRRAKIFHGLCFMASMVGLIFLGALFVSIIGDGWAYLSWDFLTNFPSRFAHKAGIQSALMGSLWMIGLTCLFAIPLGIGASVFLEEFAPKNKWIKTIEINISNLAGVPSIVYGLLGLAIFVRWFQLDRSLLAGALTMSLLILPVIIIASREAIRTVPNSLRYAALALGATKWQVVQGHVLPAAMPGIMTGIILSVSRAIGETAPLLMVGALGYVAYNPQGPMDSFTVLPIQIFNWASRPQPEFHALAASGIIVLLVVLLTMNSIAIFLRHRFQKGKVK